ncbi:MAG: indole-3-glycerol phosphate synthase TrpC [Chthoniobacterales bacterium]
MSFLDHILTDVRKALTAAKAAWPEAELRRRISDAPPVRDFDAALSSDFGLIAEIKERSPSMGAMRSENIAEAAAVYENSVLVRAISVLTNETHFGMNIARLEKIRAEVSKPILRKDFMLEEYQVIEARAFGADAILLMANILDAAQLKTLYKLTKDLGMEALFEIHTVEEIHTLPTDAKICGINSRKFKSTTGFLASGESVEKDFSLEMSVFDLADQLPKGTIRIAESGLSPQNITEVSRNFNAGLVGTSLLRDPRGVAGCLKDFETALAHA